MSFPKSDRFWLNTYKFLEQHLQAQDLIIAPKEFKEIFNNVTDYLSTKNPERVTNFQWLILHKGRLDELEVDLLKQADRFFKPVYANEVFIIFSLHNYLPPIKQNSIHLKAFNEKLVELIQNNNTNHLSSRRRLSL